MSQVTIVSPVEPERVDGLQARLAALPHDATAGGAPRSPFTGRLPPTHFARFTVIWMEADRRGGPCVAHLLFSARFDGRPAPYLGALAATREAQDIWSFCRLPDGIDARDRGSLRRHLCDRRTRLRTQYSVSAVPPGIGVAAVNDALALRAELRRFVETAAHFGDRGSGRIEGDPVAAVHDLRQLASVRRLLREL